MLRLTPLATAAIALTLVASLTACSSSDSEPRPADRPSAGTTSSSADEPEEPAFGPLDDYVGVGSGTGSSLRADDPENLEREEAIARCMAKEGFEYVPYVAPYDATFTPDGRVMLEPAKPTFPDLPPDEFAARFGYGISTKPPAARKEETDPNDAIVARMSVAERVAYQQALRGKGIVLDDQGYLAGNGISTSETSCSGQADAGEPTVEEQAKADKRIEQVRKSFGSLLKRVRDLEDAQRADPRMTAATSAWSSCLAAAGHPGFTKIEDPLKSARAAAERLLGRDLMGADDADPTRLAALRKAEVELAVADEQCMRDWNKTFTVVEQDVEQRFVSENIKELEKFRSAMSAAVAQGK